MGCSVKKQKQQKTGLLNSLEEKAGMSISSKPHYYVIIYPFSIAAKPKHSDLKQLLFIIAHESTGHLGSSAMLGQTESSQL